MARQALVLDAHAIVGLLLSQATGAPVGDVLREAREGQLSLLMCVVNAAEVMVALERAGGAEASHRTLEGLQEMPIRLVGVDLELAARAAWFKAGGGLSYGGAFAAALAHRESVPLLTGDRDFERVADRVEVRWLTN
jgi:PIN domain nuclease of toxin-antitoxin system